MDGARPLPPIWRFGAALDFFIRDLVTWKDHGARNRARGEKFWSSRLSIFL